MSLLSRKDDPFVHGSPTPNQPAWALGLVLLKLWVRCCLLGVFGPDDPWKRKLERVRARGFRGLQFFDTLKEVVWPVCIALSTAIITPYLLSATVEAVVISYLVALDLRAPPPPRGGPLAPLLDLLNGPYRRHRQGNATVLLGMRRHEVLRGVARLKQSAHLAFILLRLLLAGLRWLRRAAKRLHDTLRDERYLVGVELQDRATTPVEAVRVLPRR